jgi:hypothetical protein
MCVPTFHFPEETAKRNVVPITFLENKTKKKFASFLKNAKT